MGKAAVYHENAFVGLAECLPLRRMGESLFVQDERDRRHTRREVKRFIEAVHKTVVTPDAETYLQRRAAVAPVRTEEGRPEIPMQLPAPIAEAHAAQAAEAEFSFSAAKPIQVEQIPVSDEGDTFNFFSDQGD